MKSKYLTNERDQVENRDSAISIANLIHRDDKIRTLYELSDEVFVEGFGRLPDLSDMNIKDQLAVHSILAERDELLARFSPDSIWASSNRAWRDYLSEYKPLFSFLSDGYEGKDPEARNRRIFEKFEEFRLVREFVFRLADHAEKFPSGRKPDGFELSLPVNVRLAGPGGLIRFTTE